MINFKLEKSGYFYNLTFMKKVHKRNGEIVEEPDSTNYGIPLSKVKYEIAFYETLDKLGDKDVTLKEYISELSKSYEEICELLKKTL